MLKISGVSSGYSDILVLRDVSIEVKAGEFVALVGSNAAGKTTLMRTLMGLLRSRSGSIEFDNTRIDNLSPYQIADLGLAVVFEHSVLPRLSVRDNLLLGAYRREARAHIEETFKSVFALFPVLEERGEQIATSLSGGEQQMLCIGRALMGRPKMIALDEPSIGLSPTMVSTILKALHALNRDGLTTFLVEQNVVQTLRVSKRAYVMENGSIVLQGESEQLLHDPAVKAAYLGLSENAQITRGIHQPCLVRPPEDNRNVINGILWRLRAGAPWRNVPEKDGNWNSFYRRFRRWSVSGVWETSLSA